MNSPFQFIKRCWTQCPLRGRCAMLILSVCVNLALLSLMLAGCAHTAAGLAREQSLYQASTNAVGSIQTLVPYLPAPIATPAEIVLGLVSAGLAAWNTHQHSAIKKLAKGGSSGLPSSAPAPQPPQAPSPVAGAPACVPPA